MTNSHENIPGAKKKVKMQSEKTKFFQNNSFTDSEMMELDTAIKLITDPTIRGRFYGLIQFYNKKANHNRYYYLLCTQVSIIVPAVVMVISSLSNPTIVPYKGLISGLSALASITAGVKELGNYHENWIRFRMCAETLKSNFYRYIEEVKPYDKKRKKDRDALFILEMENIVNNETDGWLNLQNDKNDDHVCEVNISFDTLKSIKNIDELKQIQDTINILLNNRISEIQNSENNED